MSDIKSKEEKAKEVYLKMTSYAPYSEMNGIPRDWFEKCIGNGLDEYAKQQSIEFFKWYFEDAEKMEAENFDDGLLFVNDSNEKFTAEQLHDLFLDHQLKQQV